MKEPGGPRQARLARDLATAKGRRANPRSEPAKARGNLAQAKGNLAKVKGKLRKIQAKLAKAESPKQLFADTLRALRQNRKSWDGGMWSLLLLNTPKRS